MMRFGFSIADSLWVLVCTGLVFAMQGGFLCLESGLTRSKNAINVAIKNLTDFSISLLVFWVFGFGLMFGATQAGWIGGSDFLVSVGQYHSGTATLFIFQAMFCATAATIVSGAVAERMRFSAYIVATLIVSGLIYPFFGHWAWGGVLTGDSGWLESLGFVDFAGATVVHCVGGCAGLAAVLIIGPRAGRFDQKSEAKRIPASNIPMAMLGAFLLWMGWIGFNGGSTLAINGQVPGIICNTMLSGAAGMATALAIGFIRTRHADPICLINGSLAGLVAITAGCHAVTTPSAILIGLVGAVVMLSAQWILEQLRIDDAIGAFPVHAAAGAWGTVAVGLFGTPDILGTGLSYWAQLRVQVAGVAAATLVAFGTTFVLLKVINQFYKLRVTAGEEGLGLNASQHGVTTETFELLREMDTQRGTGDFSRRVTVDPFTEIGQIAVLHNKVLDKVVDETARVRQLADEANAARMHAEQVARLLHEQSEQLKHANQALEEEIGERKQAEEDRDVLYSRLLETSRRVGMADMATGVLHNVGNVLNSVNVSVSCMHDRLRASKVTGLVNVVTLIKKHSDDLGEFLTCDVKGRRLPGYLSKLATLLKGERDALRQELSDLSKHVEHIKEVVAMQQTFGQLSGVQQRLDPIEMIEDAIKINLAGLLQYGAELIREYDDGLPEIRTDKHNLLQILVNVISNAKHAIRESTDKRVTIRIRRAHDDAMEFQVEDTGAGVPAEHLTRIFNHGFTTRIDGQGFGLHSSALAAKKLGGSLTGRSDGPGEGATFTLCLPLSRETSAEEELEQCVN